MPFPDMVPALESGAVEAAIVSEPFPTLAEESGIAVRPLSRPPDAKAAPITAHLLEQGVGGEQPGARPTVMTVPISRPRAISPWATAGRATGSSTSS